MRRSPVAAVPHCGYGEQAHSCIRGCGRAACWLFGANRQDRAGAVDQAAAAIGGSARGSLELTADDLSRLAAASNVSEDVIRSTAPQADSTPLWQRTLRSAKTLEARTEGPSATSRWELPATASTERSPPSISSTPPWLVSSLASRSRSCEPSQRPPCVAVAGTRGHNSSDPEERAAAVLACYTLESVS